MFLGTIVEEQENQIENLSDKWICDICLDYIDKKVSLFVCVKAIYACACVDLIVTKLTDNNNIISIIRIFFNIINFLHFFKTK